MALVELKVARDNNVHKTATAIVKNIQESKTVNVTAIGPGAVNQAVKSIAIARGKMSTQAIELLVRIGFREVANEEKGEKTAMVFALVIS